MKCAITPPRQRSSKQHFRQITTSTSTFTSLSTSLPRSSSSSSSSSITETQTDASTIPHLKEGSTVAIGGWLISIRKISKSLAFAVLLLPRGQGKLQLIARNEDSRLQDSIVEAWDRAGIHGAIFVKGEIHSRPKEGLSSNVGDENPFFSLELHVSSTQILNSVPAGSLPFDPLDKYNQTKEEIRMKHRYLDLRSDELGHNIRLRSKVSWAVRSYLHEHDFTEIETPILLRSTPEGAREYLVPTRVNKQRSSSSLISSEPQFFALQQSPQQPKQLLIASGVTDRYFQIAKCFRDEDGRKDRQAEFTQIDLEMGFLSGSNMNMTDNNSAWRIGGQEIKKLMEGLIRAIWRAAGRLEEADRLDATEFQVLKYDDAMRRFGSDKPDLRYGLEIVELGEALDENSRDVEGENLTWEEKDEVEILCFTPPNGTISNSEMEDIFKSNKEVLEGVERFKVQAQSPNVMAKLLMRKSTNVRSYLEKKGIINEDVNVSSVVAKMQEAQVKGSLDLKDIEEGENSYLFTAKKILPASSGSTKLGDLRRLLVERMINKSTIVLPTHPHFTWITEFPLFTLTDSDKVELSKGRWSSTHHPFTSPVEEDIALVRQALSDDSPLSRNEKQRIMHTTKGQHYDLVLNGVEIGGGSIRIHDSYLQRLILKNALQLTPSELNRFNHLLQALACGAPPHGGIALGFDRLMSILCNTSTIRDVIAFPKSATSKDLLFECPDSLDPGTSLEAYGLRSSSR